MKKIKLDPNWKKSWKWFSMQGIAIASAIQTAYIALPEKMQDSLNPKMVMLLTLGILIVTAIGRLIPQESDKKE